MNHKSVWGAIDKMAADNNMSCSKLARISGLDPTTFNKSKRYGKDGKPHWPSFMSIIKILHTTNMTLCDFENLVYDHKKASCS